ncbi:uncharacterized protein EURHEDRAFT_376185 [Aspergillus ruber CBS 135680]|uniref:Uncharacterized protein n=1 Tax=Aspergillus ruber (strain CBS 135680) TaxID=1388766 RepID=A0A017SJS7_ASPRC|nr:uncharacterized protein EURHEDRAFT_376185 [Aspergillus ruber CBS 135680]EYE96919.1 hypothetical protein EURHEDRAFT_376185 [Aspergillus ruber CBS 135680]
MHYQFILISTLTTIAFAAPAPPNLRSTSTTTTTTITNTTLNKPTTHIGTPKFAHIPISIPDQRPPHQFSPNIHPIYTPTVRPDARTEPGRNPLFSRSRREDKIKRDDAQIPALAAAIRGVAESLKKRQQQQEHQNTRRADLPNYLLPDNIQTSYHPAGWQADPEEVLNNRAVDNEIYVSEDALYASEHPFQRNEQRGVDVDEGLVASYKHLATEAKSEVDARGLPLQQRGIDEVDDDDEKEEEEEEEEGEYNTVEDGYMSGNVRRDDGYDGEIQDY